MNPITAQILDFLREIGLEVELTDWPESTFLPGVTAANGKLMVDESRLLYPGDLLHEAGHLAVMTSHERTECQGQLANDQGSEIAAIAWSYAAVQHLGLSPDVVFHENGYKGSSATFIENFAEGRYVGVPLLQWMGLAVDEKTAAVTGQPPFPKMVRWLRD